jgi:hypothetical protein
MKALHCLLNILFDGGTLSDSGCYGLLTARVLVQREREVRLRGVSVIQGRRRC